MVTSDVTCEDCGNILVGNNAANKKCSTCFGYSFAGIENAHRPFFSSPGETHIKGIYEVIFESNTPTAMNKIQNKMILAESFDDAVNKMNLYFTKGFYDPKIISMKYIGSVEDDNNR